MYFSLNSIILYSNYTSIIDKAEELKNFYNNKLSIFRSFSLLNLLEEDELFQLVSLINENTYEKDYIIMNEQKCDNFYLIISGKVKHKFQNNETIMHYCEGECFGETFLLDGEGLFLKDSYIIVISDKLTTLEIPKEIFFQMLQIPKINDYIKVKMCLEDKSISLNDLYYITLLGKGKFGDVYLVHNTIFIYAIKVVSKSFIRNKTKASNYLQNENNILKYLHYQFIIKLVKTFKSKYFVYFLMEYSTGSQLDKILEIISNKMNINSVKFYGGLLFLILDYLSRQKIIHRDIKPSNIMVDSSGYIKLVDFGAAKRILNSYAKTMIGTPFFMAPEIISGKHYSFPVDYFSVGVCLYFIYYHRYPFGMGRSDVYMIYQDILKKPVSFIELNNQNYLLNDLIKNLLDKEPSVRMSNLKSVKNHQFFKNFDWDLLVTKKITPPYLPTNGENYTDQYLTNISKPFEQFIEETKYALIKNNDNLNDDDLKSEISKASGDSSWMDALF
jgi:cGMP-dependent protein kinase